MQNLINSLTEGNKKKKKRLHFLFLSDYVNIFTGNFLFICIFRRLVNIL
ncbi:hypothetical protein [Klebsiella pneumoniae IS39]|nr:hypothetical protein [Klebsiella pneumoniae IS39]